MEPVKYEETIDFYREMKQEDTDIDRVIHVAIFLIIAGACVFALAGAGGVNAITPNAVAAMLVGAAVGLFIYAYRGNRTHKKELEQWAQHTSTRMNRDLRGKRSPEELKKMRELIQMCPRLRKKLDQMALSSVQTEQYKQNLKRLN